MDFSSSSSWRISHILAPALNFIHRFDKPNRDSNNGKAELQLCKARFRSAREICGHAFGDRGLLQPAPNSRTENKLLARMGGVRQLQRNVFYSLPSLDQDPGFKLAVCGPLTVKEANTLTPSPYRLPRPGGRRRNVRALRPREFVASDGPTILYSKLACGGGPMLFNAY